MLKLTRVIKALDDVVHSIKNKTTRRRKILFYGHNEMNYNMFKPLHRKIVAGSNADVFFSFTNDANQGGGPQSKFNLDFTKQYIEPGRIIPIEKARYMKWDAVLDSDLNTPWFYRNTTFIEIFHGIAAKAITIEGGTTINYNYHPNLKRYDICFFVNQIFYDKAKELDLWKKSNSGELVGLCCLDEIISKNDPQTITYLKQKFIPEQFRSKRVIFYAPSWGEHNSFVRKGREILKALNLMDVFVVVKPHPNFLMDRISGLNNGSLESFLSKCFTNANYTLVTDSPYEVALISDALISDFGSLALEYTLLRKPVFLFRGIDQMNYIADLDQFNLLLKCSNSFHENEPITKETFAIDQLSEEQYLAMEDFENTYFANVGHATDVAFNILIHRNIICKT